MIENSIDKIDKEFKAKSKKEFNVVFLSDGPNRVPVNK